MTIAVHRGVFGLDGVGGASEETLYLAVGVVGCSVHLGLF